MMQVTLELSEKNRELLLNSLRCYIDHRCPPSEEGDVLLLMHSIRESELVEVRPGAS